MTNLTFTNAVYVHMDFESMPNLSDHWKERLGLGVGFLFRISPNELIMTQGGRCGCHGSQIIWVIDNTGEHVRSLDSLEEYGPAAVIELIKFNIPERLSKDYMKVIVK